MNALLAIIVSVEASLKAPGLTSHHGRVFPMADMLESGSSGGSEIVGEQAVEGEILPKGAPKSWAAWEGRARVAMDRAAGRLAVRHEQGAAFDEYMDFIEDSRDVDDTRWEQPGYALDPNWSTCPAVIEDQAITNSLERWTEHDGEHRGPEPTSDRLATDRVTLEQMRHGFRIFGRFLSPGQKTRSIQWGVGLKSLTEIEATNRVDYISRKGSQDTAYMAHGRQSREDTFWRITELLHRGENALASGIGGLDFLSWLKYGWTAIEAKISAGRNYRKAHEKNKTLACGRGYYLTYDQCQHLRSRRKAILRRYSKGVHGVAKGQARGKSFILAYARKYWGFQALTATGFGTRKVNHLGLSTAPRQKTLDTWPLTESARTYLADKVKRVSYSDGIARDVSKREVVVAHIIRRGRKATV